MNTTQPFSDIYLKLEDMMANFSTGCIFLNQDCEIININIAASKMLKVKTLGHYTSMKLKLYPDFHPIMLDLLNGKTVSDVRLSLKCMDNNSVHVNLKASLFYGIDDLFIFQFTEINSFVIDEYLHKLSNSLRMNIQMIKLQYRKLYKVYEKKVLID